MKAIRCLPLLAVSLGLFSGAVSTPNAAGADRYFVETFTQNPLGTGGWVIHGDNSLFTWDAARQNLAITWDSSKPNSYFHRPIGITLTRSNDFLLGFDLLLSEVQIGTHAGMPFTFQLSVGMLNVTNATDPAFLRGTGFSAPNLVEFSYFPDSGFGATVAPTIISADNDYNTGGFTYPLAVDTGALYHVEMRFIAEEQRLVSRVLRDGVPIGPVQDARLQGSFTDFAVDQIAIMSYSDAGQDPMYAGSIHALGTIDNLFVMVPPPIAQHHGHLTNQVWSTTFTSHLDWTYQLERSSDLAHWTATGELRPGTGATVTLDDPAAPAGHAFYRVIARRN